MQGLDALKTLKDPTHVLLYEFFPILANIPISVETYSEMWGILPVKTKRNFCW
jgi:hypothetical protein